MHVATQPLVTVEKLYALGEDCRCELVRGVLVAYEPAFLYHGSIAARVTRRIDSYASRHGGGLTVTADTGFVISRNPDTVLAPDVAFIAKRRLRGALQGVGFFEGSPDLAVEVKSKDNSLPQLRRKAAQYIVGGTAIVWVIVPSKRCVEVITEQGSRTVGGSGALTGGRVLPGLRIRVSDLFP